MTAPGPLTKSKHAALGCELHFAQRYVRRIPSVSTEGMRLGRVFHDYRQQYLAHLQMTGQSRDPEWVKRWVARQACTLPARELILADADTFAIDPRADIASELSLAVDRDFHPLLHDGPAPPPEAFAWGRLDRLELAGGAARIVDPKTGWSHAVNGFEATLYAALVFAHYPAIDEVEFAWDFIRAGAEDAPVTFNRAFLPIMHDEIRQQAMRMEAIYRKVAAGEALEPDPAAGLCGRCPYSCPLRSHVTSGALELGPVQTEQDAQLLGLKILAADEYLAAARQLLRAYLAEHGQVALGHGLWAWMRSGCETTFPLDAVLRVLGFADVPETSREWDIPLSSLQVGSTGLKEKAKAKKRAGMWDRLQAIAKRRPKFDLQIGAMHSDEG